ncbi:MAG: radical SAM family heme chaperone HemW [bacterium]
MNPLAVYIHFPYCLYKCHYCDFNSYPVEWSGELESSYLKTLNREVDLASRTLPPFRITSVFLGGGTPSLFSPEAIEAVLKKLAEKSSFSEDCEVTIEMNPKTVTFEKLKGFMSAGVTRFSLGVQSFEDRYLAPLGRLHTGEEALQAIEGLQKAGIENYNLDLMFGFPHQTVSEVLEDLRKAVAPGPRHLSFYNLTLEEGTLLYDQHKKGKICLPENEIQAEMYERGLQFLEEKGYGAYEISNFSKSSPSRHNLAYWRYEDYLGLGAGAVSFLRASWFAKGENESVYGYRWTNPRTPKEYGKAVEGPWPFSPFETIERKTAPGEFWMMGLRLKEGVDLAELEKRFGKGSREIYAPILYAFEKKGWMEREGEWARLTSRGRMLANEVVSGFLL